MTNILSLRCSVLCKSPLQNFLSASPARKEFFCVAHVFVFSLFCTRNFGFASAFSPLKNNNNLAIDGKPRASSASGDCSKPLAAIRGKQIDDGGPDGEVTDGQTQSECVGCD